VEKGESLNSRLTTVLRKVADLKADCERVPDAVQIRSLVLSQVIRAAAFGRVL
jgi:hypothetical protein